MNKSVQSFKSNLVRFDIIDINCESESKDNGESTFYELRKCRERKKKRSILCFETKGYLSRKKDFN